MNKLYILIVFLSFIMLQNCVANQNILLTDFVLAKLLRIFGTNTNSIKLLIENDTEFKINDKNDMIFIAKNSKHKLFNI